MQFFNHASREVWLGLYSPADTLYTFTLKQAGARVQVSAGQSWTSDIGLPNRVQVATWDSGAFGKVIAQPRSMLSDGDVSFAEDMDGAHIYYGRGLPTPVDKLQHLFVLMLENRSFDHILGWLYEDTGNVPPRNHPPELVPRFDGLVAGSFWNTPMAADHDSAGGRVYATKVARPTYTKPNPNPPEICPRFIEGMFGTEEPAANAVPSMSGFIQAYGKVEGGNADVNGIMESYTPGHLPQISGLARSFAVCDGWFGAVPCMTWPNRSFLHAGTSFGRLNNNDGKYAEGNPPDIVPNFFGFAGQRTVFDELDAIDIPYGLYTESALEVTLLGAQFFTLKQKGQRPFRQTNDLAEDLAKKTVRQLPWYTFIEPEYLIGANDQHPPKDVRIGDELIGKVFGIVSASPIWRKSALLILYDEHGGCYDHVAPPPAIPPDASPAQFTVGEINPFAIYGPRVPAVFATPLLDPGLVFRSPGTPYDHTSVLSTLRDMIYPFGDATPFFTGNPRIASAPTLGVLFKDSPAPSMQAAIDLLLLSE